MAPQPIRVLVRGASTVVYLAEMGGPRTDFNFGRVIEAEVLAAGRPIDISVHGLPSQLAKHSVRSWERDVMGWSPDVIVLHHGHYESIHYVLPRWLERYANSTRWRPRGRLHAFYRTRIVRAAWVTLAKWQSRADRRFDSTLFRRKLHRVAADVERLIQQVQTVGSPLVLVLEVVPPGKRWQSWMPGLTERTAVVNAALEAAIRRIDRPNVRFVPTVAVLTAELDEGEEPTPDGGHYSARAHRVLGSLLSREILAWADTQPHLQLPEERPVRRLRGTERAG